MSINLIVSKIEAQKELIKKDMEILIYPIDKSLINRLEGRLEGLNIALAIIENKGV